MSFDAFCPHVRGQVVLDVTLDSLADLAGCCPVTVAGAGPNGLSVARLVL